jgi:riboflavin synthase
MFTGIISEIGRIASVRPDGGGLAITVEAPATSRELKVDDSVSVNGVCQTVIGCTGSAFDVQAVEETLVKTTFRSLRAGSRVNLELPVRLQDRLGGHLVQGHVDTTGRIVAVSSEGLQRLVTVEFSGEFRKYVIPVGSIAIDGVSLTVAALHENRLTVAVIPHTVERTTLAGKGQGDEVNLEFDLIGKYLESLMGGAARGGPPGGLDEDTLRSWGY